MDFQIKDMTRANMKALREAGLDPSFKQLDAEKMADMVDWIIEHVYADEQAELDAMNYKDVMDIALRTYRHAMTGEDEIPNSSNT